jgi:DNA processing protein
VHTLRRLLENFENLEHVWDADPEKLSELFALSRVKNAPLIIDRIKSQHQRLIEGAKREFEQLDKRGVQIIKTGTAVFPERLASVPGAPYWLFVEGFIAPLHYPLIAVVGTREPSEDGMRTARYLTSLLATEGFGIISGLAEGIDDVAHQTGSLYNVPQVGVLGTGINVTFPTSTKSTREELLRRGGAVITEYLPEATYADRSHFVERDRIQAALALAVVPVESRAQSGTAHTLRFAEKYGRPVFGVRKGNVAPENEMLQVLKERAHPVFDLSSASEFQALLAWLRATIGDEQWPRTVFTLDHNRALKSVLSSVSSFLNSMRLTELDHEHLKAEIQKLFEE